MNLAWAILAGSFQGCIGGLVLWNVLNRMVKVNGVGLLERQPWPINDMVASLVAGTVLGAIGGLIYGWRGRQRSLRLAEEAGRLGLDFQPTMPRKDWETWAFSSNWVSVDQVWQGQRPGWAFLLADVTQSTGRGAGDQGPKTQTKTWAILEFPEGADGDTIAAVPDMSIAPRGWGQFIWDAMGWPGIRFDANALTDPAEQEIVRSFQKRFLVFTIDWAAVMMGRVQGKIGSDAPQTEVETRIRQCLTLSVMEAWLSAPALFMQSRRGRLAFWEKDRCLGPQERLDLLERAVPLARTLLESAQTLETNRVVPGLAGYGQKRLGWIFGCTMAGFIGGFFLGFIGGFFLFIFLLEGLKLDKNFLFVGLSFFGSILGGAVLGALSLGWLGNRLAHLSLGQNEKEG